MICGALLFSFAAILESKQLHSLRDPEIWGHIQTGTWILKNKSWPRVGLFSQAGNLPWMDFSWGYSVVTAVAYRMLGLRALPALLMGFRVALAGISFLLAGGRRGNFWSAFALSATAQYVLFDMGQLGACTSVILLGAELLLLLECRRSGNSRLLFWLPALFLVWTNMDLGFVYGLGLYGLFLAALGVERMSVAAKWTDVQPLAPEIPLGNVVSAGCACVVASVLSPYSYHGYAAFLGNLLDAVDRYLPPYTAMNFHQPQHYALLLLTMTAFLSLGLRRSRDSFQLAVLIGCTILAFHSQGDKWLVTLGSVAVIGEAILPRADKITETQNSTWSRWTLATAGLTVAIVVLTFAFLLPRQRDVLMAKIAENFPVRACDTIRKRQLPQPLFNSYAWGSFLTWYLPEYPVAIDGRRGLYPEEEELNYFKVMKVEAPYQSLPSMKQARTLLLEEDSVVGQGLKNVPGFHVAYEDNISIVLLHEPGE